MEAMRQRDAALARVKEMDAQVERLTKGIHTMRWGVTDWMQHMSACDRLLDGKSIESSDAEPGCCMWCREWPKEWTP